MRVDIYSDFTLKDILQSYSSIQFSECIRDVGDIQLSFTDNEVYKNIKVTEDVLVVGNNAYLAENKHKTDSKDLRKYEITGRHITSVLSWRCVKGFEVPVGETYEDACIRLVQENFISPPDKKRTIPNFTFKRLGLSQKNTVKRIYEANDCLSILKFISKLGGFGFWLEYDIQEKKLVLSLRQQLAKSSVKKYTAIENAVCMDSRVRGMFQFYGANRTGRFAGRLVQLQNLPQNHISDLAQARGLVRCGNFDALEFLYDDIPDTLSQLIRTAFVPQGDNKFIVADFSAIEARVLAWLADEKWRIKVFEEGKDKEKNVPVFFEKENINTMDSKGEVLLTIMASLAQQESESLSKNVKMGIQFRYQNGEVQVNHNWFLGYTKDENGHLIIDEDQAVVVRRIFREYLQGASLKTIADGLMADGIPTATGNMKWRGDGIRKILTNEKYTGDALLQKTYTVDVLTKKRVSNNGIVPQYYVENNHEAIIPRQLFMQVQEELFRRAHLKTEGGKTKRVYSSKYALSSIVYCGKCGDLFRRVAWKARGASYNKWRCASRIEKGPKKGCDADAISEVELQNAVVRAINKTLGGREQFLIQLQYNIEEVLNGDSTATLV